MTLKTSSHSSIFIVLATLTHVTFSMLPSYVHLHTAEEIMETQYTVLNKLNICLDSVTTQQSLLIAIKTSPANYEQRNILRKTWLIDVINNDMSYIFVLGSTTDKTLSDKILREDKDHEDLLIGKTIDNYYNLTLKSIFITHWTKTHCPRRWLLYVDDDTIVNVQNTINFVAEVKNSTNGGLYCRIRDSYVIRNSNSKWFVPTSIWHPEKYPAYCHGFGYLIAPEAVISLYEASILSTTEPKLWIEDVFLTGIAAKVVNMKQTESQFVCCGRGNYETFQKSLVLGEMGKQNTLFGHWQRIQQNWTSGRYASFQSILTRSRTSRWNETLNPSAMVLLVDQQRKANLIITQYESIMLGLLGAFISIFVLFACQWTRFIIRMCC
jgi:hypothetical protein